MIKNPIIILLFSCFACFSCIGDHNKSHSKGLNLESTRIYGDKNKPARQLSFIYPEDKEGKVADRIAKIREKLYPN